MTRENFNFSYEIIKKKKTSITIRKDNTISVVSLFLFSCRYRFLIYKKKQWIEKKLIENSFAPKYQQKKFHK